ncbi:MAG TPA: cell division FtsA domain-containing protein [Candidatus Saccharimonadales bacterium]|nr:cell division FtsA domain-containing protein [Candidatus Saccharimonadales bacterium]
MILDKLHRKKPAGGHADGAPFVALDIGTEYVKALIARVNGEAIEIIGMGRAHQGLDDMHSGAIADIAGVVHNCEQALGDAEQQAGVTGRQAVLGIAGELVKGVTHTIRYKRPQPEKPLDMREMEFIIQKVQERAHEKVQRQVARETGNPDVEIKLVNSAIVSIHIDSYKVSNPIGFQGKDVAIQIYTAFAPMVHIGALEQTANELDLDLLAVAAEPFAVSRSVLGTDASSNFTAILVDIGGGTTDIAVINDGGVEGTKSYGIGGRAFTRTIANEMDIDFGKAEDMKIKLGTGELNGADKAKVISALKKTLGVWLDGLELALSEFDAIDHLPSRILLCGGGASLQPLVLSLRETSWYKNLPFTKQPSIHHVTPDDVAGIRDVTGKVHDHTFVTAMGLLRVGYDTIEGTGEQSDSIKDKFNRMLRI